MERLTCKDYAGHAYWRSGKDGGYRSYTASKIERDGLDKLAAYEDTGLEPDEIMGPYDNLKAHLYDVEHELNRYKQAEAEGRLMVLDDNTVLALAAGARAMENNPRLSGASYKWDVFGKHGGPKDISYYEAAKKLREISDPIVESWRDAALPEVVE